MKQKSLWIVIMTIIMVAGLTAADMKTVNFTGNAFQPVFSEDGSYLVFRASSGLYIYDLQNEEAQKIADRGFDPVMDKQGVVRYRIDNYIEGRRFGSIVTYDVQKDEVLSQSKSIRYDAAPKITEHGVYYTAGKRISHDLNLAKTASRPVAFTYGDAVLLYTFGTSQYLQPGGQTPHLWPSVSPDQSKLCVVAENDILICDLNGNVMTEVENGRAPSWSPDSRYIAFMRDEDNGEVQTASEIFIYDLLTNSVRQLTDTKNKIEMYPAWSPDGSTIVCEDAANGTMYLINRDEK